MGNGKIEDLTFNGDGTKVYAIGFSGQHDCSQFINTI